MQTSMKRQYNRERVIKPVDNPPQSGIIKESNIKPITKITDSAIDRVPKVEIGGYSDERNDSIKTITIVKNSGNLETLTKIGEFSKLSLLRELKRLEKNSVKVGSDNEVNKAIEVFLVRNKELIIWNKNK